MSAFSFWGSIIYYNYGSGDLQPWAKTEVNQEQKEQDRPIGSHDTWSCSTFLFQFCTENEIFDNAH